METIARHMNYKKYDNYTSICVGLHLFTIGIYDFVVDNIKKEHAKLYIICARGTCTKKNCSKRFKMFSDWCQNCRDWKAELKKIKSNECRHWKKINWQDLNSFDWPQSIDEMAKVFVKNPSIHYRDGVFYDIGAVMSILTNMSIFAFDKTTVEDIKRIRNEYYGHNYRTGIHDAEKNIFFDRILHFIRLKEIRRYRSAIECIPALEELQTTKDLTQKLLEKLVEKDGLNDVRDVVLCNVARQISGERATFIQDEMAPDSQIYSYYKSRLDELIVPAKSEIEDRRPRGMIQNKLQLGCKHLFRLMTKLILRNTHLIRLLLFSTLFVSLKKPKTDHAGCMSMRFQHQWMSAIDFDFYIQELNSSSIIERVWLEPVLTSSLKKQTHVLLSANIGYGKSTTVSQIMCAGVYSPWHHFRQMVNAYHMCRFNYKASIQSDIFIRNLAGKIVNDVPELGNAILADEHALDYLEEYKCRQDPFLCLEIVILAPMKHIQTKRKYLIIIDGLDECDTLMGNDLYDLLAQKLSDFPSFFMFLFTSRKISKVLYEFKTLQNVLEIDLESFEERNILDAQRFIEITSSLTNEKKLQLVNLSNGNLLHINSYLDYCRKNTACEFSKVPKTLENIYHFNLERILGTNGSTFVEWNAIFEVLCAAANPIDLDELFLISGLNDNKRITFSILLGNEFGHFLKHNDNKLSFQHKSFKEFLTNESRKLLPFYINITKGHTLFTKHLLHKPTSKNLLNEKALLDIASHVALTYNKQFAKSFLKLFNRTHLEHYRLLMYMAREVNCYDTANLVIQLIIQSGLSSSNMSNAAFIASSNGNVKTLISFHENKVNFKSKYNLILEHTLKGANLVHMCKFVFFCGYNVLHIAAQRGYVEIVDYLLNKYPDILYEQNSIHLNAFQLAAENGQTKLVKLFLEIDSSLADQHSLYYASQQGHDEIVSLLLNYVDDTCLPCNENLYWLPTLSFRKQNNVTIPIETLDKKSNYFQYLDFSQLVQMQQNTKHAVLSDDWRLITCESALNAAVRNGHLSIVKSLLEEKINALHCTMFDGSTPLMTAAMFDQTEVFRFLDDSGGNLAFRCKSKFSYQDKIGKEELDLLKEKTCPENGSISHLLAIHDSYGIIKYLLNKGFEDWESRDINGLTPSHYAFCCNSNNFIKLVVFADKYKVHSDLNSKSANGSTPYHSAAICKSLILTHYVDTSVRTLPDKVDNNNRSILHYGLMQLVSQEDAIQIDRVGKDYFSDLLLRVALNNKHDYLRVDGDGRNVLHYAASSGNYCAFLKVLQILKKSEINVLLYCKDKRGYTPLKAAFDSLTPRQAFESLKIPLNCSLNELFSTTCKANLSVILLPHEYFIFTVTEYLSSSTYFTPLDVKDYLTLAINKSRIYPILILKSYTPREFNAIVSTSTEIPTLLAKSDIQIIAEHIFNVDNSLRCNNNESPLHQLVLNAMNGQDILPLNSFLTLCLRNFLLGILINVMTETDITYYIGPQWGETSEPLNLC
ncbi:unnamed protein product [Mytilus coruscus]|uniref:Nephrocystin 3-like N-terminal domain-containing protein n=1 Tax=Mytilus coruscus TaxID=42192 RepID=A0A6J8AAP0_MYTCO|nr:unnamed protein product [Mytilus coruscus]